MSKAIGNDCLCEIFSWMSMKEVRKFRVFKFLESDKFLSVYEKNNKVECRKYKFMLYAIRNMYFMMPIDKFVQLKMTPELLIILESRADEIGNIRCEKNESIPFEFYEKHPKICRLNIVLSNGNNIPVQYYEKHIECIEFNDWYCICRKNLPEWFFEKHIDKWKSENNWYIIIENKCISTQFIEKNLQIDSNLSKYIWSGLCNKNFPASFYEKHISCVSFTQLAYRTDLPLEFYKKHIDKFITLINILIRNPSISFEFLLPHINKKHYNTIINYLK